LSPKFTKRDQIYQKNQLEKSNPLMENFAIKGFMLTPILILVFLPSFAEIGKAVVTKRVRRIIHEKGWYFAPFSGASAAINTEIQLHANNSS